jgi:hypothetical protein
MMDHDALALRPGDRIRLIPHSTWERGAPRQTRFTVWRVDHSPDFTTVTIVTTDDLRLPLCQVEPDYD